MSAAASTRDSRFAAASRRYLPPALFLAGLAVCWEVAVRSLDVAPWILPAPSAVWAAFTDIGEVLPGHIATTMTEALLGLLIAAVAGASIAALIASMPLARRLTYPLLVLSQNIPLIVLAPLLVVWFGFGIEPKVAVVALIGFFPIVVSTAEGLMRTDPDLVDLVRSTGASRWQMLRAVRIPAAVPAFFAGLQISTTYAVLGAVIGEWVGATSGLGLFITRSQTAFRTDRVFVAVVVIAALSIALFGLVHVIARLVMPWQYASEREQR
jgi:ABC-type nitrate/sulfonate/bicarbonate transport system permease component